MADGQNDRPALGCYVGKPTHYVARGLSDGPRPRHHEAAAHGDIRRCHIVSVLTIGSYRVSAALAGLPGLASLKSDFTMKSKILRKLKVAALAFVGLVLIVATAIYGISNYRLNRQHEVPILPKLTLSSDLETLGRGGHIATSFGMCTECHGGDLGGKVFIDAGPLGVVVGPNLTRGRGGVGGILTDADYVKAIRHGVRHDGKSLMVMPSEVFAQFTEDDLSALVSYLKQLTPIDREVPASELHYLGRTLLVADKLHVLTAEKVSNLPIRKTIDRTPSVSYGLYLATIGGCRSCHRANLSGGSSQAPGNPPAANLTPSGHIGSWTETDFVRTLRTGKRPNGKNLHPAMPWPQAGMMTDDELHAVWLYLKSVPPKPFGNN